MPTPTPTAIATTSVTHAVQRGEAQTGLSLIRPFVFGTTRRIDAVDASGNVYMPFTSRRAGAFAAHVAAATCSNGATRTSSQSGSVTTFTTQFFYDAACSMKWQVINGTTMTTQPDSSDLTEVTNATDTVYGTNGSQIEVDNATVDYAYFTGGENLTISATSGPDANTIRDTFTLACSSIPQGTSCSPADLQYLATSDAYPAVGAVDKITNAGTSASFNSMATYYAGTIAQTALSGLTISGAAYSQSLTAVQNYVFDSSNHPRLSSIATMDAVNGVKGQVNEAATSVTGQLTLAASGTVIAKYTLDINGSGSIQYADGTLEPVSAFAIQQ